MKKYWDAKLTKGLIFAASCLGLLADVIFIAIATKSLLIIIPSVLSTVFLAVYVAHLTILRSAPHEGDRKM